MFSALIYLMIISLLVFWIDSQSNLSHKLLIIKENPGDLLEDWLKKFSWGKSGEVGDKQALPKYKFYSEVVESLLSLARRMGGNYQEALLYLREGLQSDRQFEKKLKEVVLGCWFQMIFVMGITWAFILGSVHLVSVQISPVSLFYIGLWQIIGLSQLPLLLNYFRRKFFGDIGKIWKMLYVLNSLSRVPLSRSEVFTIAGVQELREIKQKSLISIVEKLKEVCLKALKQGGNYEQEIKYLMEELRFQEKWHFELFEKRLVVVKLGLLSLFFLPSYLAFIFLLLGDLMDLM